MGNYLVTGAAGFIGSYIAKRLLDRGDTVVTLDNITTGFESNIPKGCILVEGDISDPKTFHQIPKGRYDAALHLAAQSSGEISHEVPGIDINTNALGTLNLLNWCQSEGVSRFLHASSMAIYGLTEHMPVVETQVLDPYSFYGISKQASEQFVKHFSKHGLDTTIFRMFNVYGPVQNLSNMKQGMVSIYLAYLINEEPILVKGSLDRFRDFIFIDDVVDAWIAALDNSKSYGRIYNLASGQKTLVRDMIPDLIRACGYDPETYPVEHGEGTPGDQFGIYADISAISTDLGWKPRIDMPEGLRKMASWAKDLH